MLQELTEEKGQTQSLYIFSPLVSAFCAAGTNDHRLSHVEHPIFIISHFCWSQVEVAQLVCLLPVSQGQGQVVNWLRSHRVFCEESASQFIQVLADAVPCSCTTEVSVSLPAVGWEPFSASMGHCIPWLVTFFLHQGFLISPSSLSATSF